MYRRIADRLAICWWVEALAGWTELRFNVWTNLLTNWLIVHFRVPKTLTFKKKTECKGDFHLHEIIFISMDKTLNLALKKRLKAVEKLPNDREMNTWLAD